MAIAALVLLIVAPTLVLLARGARLRWSLLGVGSWMLALMVKIAAVLALYRFDGTPRAGLPATAAAHGTISAVLELGFAALFLRRRAPRLIDAIAFGAAIGSFEVLWTLFEAALELDEAGELTVANLLAVASVPFLFERGITLVSHTASRVLIWAALTRRRLRPAAIALALFALCDGVAACGAMAGWDWEDPRVVVGFDLFLAALALIETAAAWRFCRPPRVQVEV